MANKKLTSVTIKDIIWLMIQRFLPFTAPRIKSEIQEFLLKFNLEYILLDKTSMYLPDDLHTKVNVSTQ